MRYSILLRAGNLSDERKIKVFKSARGGGVARFYRMFSSNLKKSSSTGVGKLVLVRVDWTFCGKSLKTHYKLSMFFAICRSQYGSSSLHILDTL